jgi:hypothetical protein
VNGLQHALRHAVGVEPPGDRDEKLCLNVITMVQKYRARKESFGKRWFAKVINSSH